MKTETPDQFIALYEKINAGWLVTVTAGSRSWRGSAPGIDEAVLLVGKIVRENRLVEPYER